MSIESMQRLYRKAKPFLAVVFIQVGFSGMDIISKAALNQGMSNYVFVVYRHAVATIVIAPFAFALDKKIRPNKMTTTIFLKLMLLGLLEPVIDQNLYFLGMKYTTATFATAMANVLPALTFVIACLFRLEKVKMMSIRSQAKIIGTIATVAGAMIMTLVTGPIIDLPWTRPGINHTQQPQVNLHDSIKGAIMITVGCLSWACFMILQAVTLQTYPAELSLTAWICLLGSAEGAALALVMENGNPAAWSIGWDTKFLAAVYSGIFCSGITYYLQGVVMKERGPVFVTAFSPLGMVLVAILSSFILAEQMFLGRVVGAIVIVMGLYFVVWGKSKDYETEVIEEQELPVKQTTNLNEGSIENSNLEGGVAVKGRVTE